MIIEVGRILADPGWVNQMGEWIQLDGNLDIPQTLQLSGLTVGEIALLPLINNETVLAYDREE